MQVLQLLAIKESSSKSPPITLNIVVPAVNRPDLAAGLSFKLPMPSFRDLVDLADAEDGASALSGVGAVVATRASEEALEGSILGGTFNE